MLTDSRAVMRNAAPAGGSEQSDALHTDILNAAPEGTLQHCTPNQGHHKPSSLEGSHFISTLFTSLPYVKPSNL